MCGGANLKSLWCHTVICIQKPKFANDKREAGHTAESHLRRRITLVPYNCSSNAVLLCLLLLSPAFVLTDAHCQSTVLLVVRISMK